MSKYQRNTKTVYSKLDDEIVMIDIEIGEYFSLNPVASRIWEMIESPLTLEEICTSLMDEYDIDAATCTKEVEAFITELSKKKLIIKSA